MTPKYNTLSDYQEGFKRLMPDVEVKSIEFFDEDMPEIGAKVTSMTGETYLYCTLETFYNKKGDLA